MNSLIETQECKSWAKRILYATCVSIVYMIIGNFVEPYIMNAKDYVTGLMNGSVATSIVGLILYIAAYAALTIGCITGIKLYSVRYVRTM